MRICVIGAGPAGLACVKTLNSEPGQAFSIDVYEMRAQIGGVWNYTADKEKYNNEEDLARDGIKDYSPIYTNLETNIIHKLMAYKDFPFKVSSDFPRHDQVLQYLLDYSETIGPSNIILSTEIIAVDKQGDKWQVKSKNLKTGENSSKIYDYVMVANGSFNVPYYPDIPGLKDWGDHLSHAKFFENIEIYRNKNVLLIGGLSSGVDVALHLSKVVKKVYVSVKKGEKLIGEFDKLNPYIEVVSEVGSTDYTNKTATYKNGATLENIDAIVVCTGYMTGKSFIHLPIIHDSYIDELYHQIFWYRDPSIMFIGLPRNVHPFPMAELQSSYASRYISGRLKLPTESDMEQSYKQDIEGKVGKSFHDYKTPIDIEYFKKLQDIIKEQGLEDGFNSAVYEGKRLEMKLKSSEYKLMRIKEVSDGIVASRK